MVFDEFYLYFIYDGDGFVEGVVIVVDIVVMVYCKIFDGDLIIEVVEVVIFFGLEDLEIVFVSLIKLFCYLGW